MSRTDAIIVMYDDNRGDIGEWYVLLNDFTCNIDSVRIDHFNWKSCFRNH